MRKFLIVFVVILLVTLAFDIIKGRKLPMLRTKEEELETQQLVTNEVYSKLRLTTKAFELNKDIPELYTCQGSDISPQFSIYQPPVGTKSFVLIMEDRDALSKSFTHWLVFNINPDVSLIYEGALPAGGVEGINDFGNQTYNGPCPKEERHKYVFTLYALDALIDAPRETEKATVLELMKAHVLAKVDYGGFYEKKQIQQE